MSATGLSKTRSPRLPGKLLRLLFNTLIIAGLAYLAFIIGDRILAMIDPAEPAPVIEVAAPPPQAEPAAHEDASEELAALHLFGKAEEKSAVPLEHKVAPETKLDLTLRGIFAGDKINHGIAIIQNNHDREERHFTIKQTVFRLATLEEIYEDRVILLHNGRYETLRLPKESLSREHFYDSAEIQAEKKRVASDYRDRFLSRDPDQLIKLFGFKETYQAGSFAGFRVKALGEEGLDMMRVLGIEDGDLITVLNGKRFSEGLEAFEEIKKLKTATSVDVIIDRNGNEIPFHFELESPAIATSAEAPGTTAGSSPTSGNPAAGADTYTPDSTTPGTVTSAGSPSVGTASRDSGSEDAPAVEDWESSTAGVSKSRRATRSTEEANLGEDWDDSEGAAEYRAIQQERSKPAEYELEYDH